MKASPADNKPPNAFSDSEAIFIPRYKKANKAVKTIKEFLARHMKVYDKDLNKIKLDKYLNEVVWARGIKKPPIRVKVRAVKEAGIVTAELVDVPDKLKFKKAREEKRDKKAEEVVDKKKSLMEKAKAGTAKPAPKEGVPSNKGKDDGDEGKSEEKKVEEKEKKAAVVEAGEEMEKATAKQAKHATQTAGKQTKQKHQVRKALAK